VSQGVGLEFKPQHHAKKKKKRKEKKTAIEKPRPVKQCDASRKLETMPYC
jgi:hypothetical protein